MRSDGPKGIQLKMENYLDRVLKKVVRSGQPFLMSVEEIRISSACAIRVFRGSGCQGQSYQILCPLHRGIYNYI